MAKVVGTLLVLLAGLGLQAVQAGFRSPESLIRNVYAYYGDRSSDLSSGLPAIPPPRVSSSIRVCGAHGVP